jgi:hypothetical protein
LAISLKDGLRVLHHSRLLICVLALTADSAPGGEPRLGGKFIFDNANAPASGMQLINLPKGNQLLTTLSKQTPGELTPMACTSWNTFNSIPQSEWGEEILPLKIPMLVL